MSFVNSISSGLFSSPKKRKTVSVIGFSAIVLMFLGSQYIFSDNQDNSIPKTRVKKGNIVIKITESGELRAKDQVTISAVTDKQILYLAPEGSRVQKGDTLVVYESAKYAISKGEAESNLLVAESQLIQAESDLEAQEAKEEGARQQYGNMLQLSKEGFAVESEVEQSRLNYLQLKSKTKSFQAGVRAAEAQVKAAERAVEQQDRKLRQGIVFAPRDGLVVYAYVGNPDDGKKVEVGMVPFEGMDLMYLPDISSMLVDTQISEVDLYRVQEGLTAAIHLDAYPDAIFDGEVASIADLARRRISRITGKATGAKVFDVTIKVMAQDVRLKPGLTATVDIIIDKLQDAIYVPLEAVFLDELERTIVYINKNGTFEPRVVETGDSNDRVVVIKSGLAEGVEVLLARPTEI